MRHWVIKSLPWGVCVLTGVSAGADAQVLCHHKPVYDARGILLPWT